MLIMKDYGLRMELSINMLKLSLNCYYMYNKQRICFKVYVYILAKLI